MQEAVKEALGGVAKNHGGPFGAVIVKDGKIIAKAHNQVVKSNDPTAHAEINVIKKASKKLRNLHNLYALSYVQRGNKMGKYKNYLLRCFKPRCTKYWF